MLDLSMVFPKEFFEKVELNMEFTFNTLPSEPDISSFDNSVDPGQLASHHLQLFCQYMLIIGILQVNWMKIGE